MRIKLITNVNSHSIIRKRRLFYLDDGYNYTSQLKRTIFKMQKNLLKPTANLRLGEKVKFLGDQCRVKRMSYSIAGIKYDLSLLRRSQNYKANETRYASRGYESIKTGKDGVRRLGLREVNKNIFTSKIYTFDKWKEVGKFYIDMNENITHSKKDIQKVKDWFLAKHNIEL